MMRGWSITFLLAATLALAALFGPSAATATTAIAAKKCGPGTTNPYCEKPPPCRDHKCVNVASNLAVSSAKR
jgi:hypothetical protein